MSALQVGAELVRPLADPRVGDPRRDRADADRRVAEAGDLLGQIDLGVLGGSAERPEQVFDLRGGVVS